MDYFTRSFFAIISSSAFGFIVAMLILKESFVNLRVINC